MELTLSEGDNCIQNPSKTYELVYEIICDKNAASPIIDLKSPFDSNSCLNRIRIYSNAGCPQMKFYSIFNSIISNKFIFGPILIGLGIFICFFGNYFYLILCILIGILCVSFIFLFLVFSNINISFSNTLFWIVIGSVIIIGILIGYYLYEKDIVIDFLIGGITGYLLGLFLYNFAFNKIYSNPKVVFWFTIIGSIIVSLILVFTFKSLFVIFGTSFIGAYGAIRVNFFIEINKKIYEY